MAARAREGATKQGGGGAQLQPDSRRMAPSRKDSGRPTTGLLVFGYLCSASAPLSQVSLVFDKVVFWEMRPKLILAEIESFKDTHKLKTQTN